MKIHCATSDLLDAVRSVASVASGKTTLPILGHILLSVGDGTAWLTATNLDETLRCQIPVGGSRDPESVAIPARLFSQILANSASPDTLLEWDGGNKPVRLLNGGGTYKLEVLPAEDFPVIQHPDLDDKSKVSGTFAITASKLREAIRLCGGAISTDESRQALTCLAVFLTPPDGLTFVATDGRQLVEKPAVTNLSRLVLPEGVTSHCLLIPKHAVKVFATLGEGEDQVVIRFDPNRVEARCGRMEVIVKQKEGGYPNYKQVIPKQWMDTVTVNRKELLTALAQLDHVTTDKSEGVLVEPGTGEQIVLTAQSPDIGLGRVTLNCIGKITRRTRLRLSYLKNLVAGAATDNVRLSMIDELTPFRIQPETADSTGIVMPMALN